MGKENTAKPVTDDSKIRRFKKFVFREKNVVATLVLALVIIAGVLASYFACYKIARERGLDQFEDAVNSVIDQVNSKFERDGEILRSMADVLSASEAFASEEINLDELRTSLSELKPLQQTMNLRILTPNDEVLMPDDQTLFNKGFVFSEEVVKGEHISERFESQRADVKGTPQVIAHFVPIIKDGVTVAMLYGVTALSDLPKLLKTSNIYNSSASVMILDVSSAGHDIILDTGHKSAPGDKYGSFDEYEMSETRGKSSQEVLSEIFGLKRGYVQLKSESKGRWLYFYYAPASGVVSDKWSICISVPADIAFGNIKQVQNVFIIVGVLFFAALACYFVFVRFSAKEAIRKSVERAVLEEKLHKAEAAERAKTAFLSNMSHDIRTPMNAILGYTALAETNINNKERVEDYLKKILSSGNHLLSLINDILDMSRIESGKLNIEEKPCNISDIFRDMRNIIQTQMKSKQLNFFMDTLDVIDEDIFCDKLHVNQVLLNLLSNSIKFTPPGGSISLTIRQKSNAPTGYGAYEIRVKDTGIGMSPEFAKHIFEPFERERTSTVSGIQGTGLGMAITKNIVDTMGGTIEVLTEKDKGSEFIINLQFRLQTERRNMGAIRELEGLRALVVDDSFTTCDSVSKMLVTIGMHAEWTMYGREAVLRTQQAVDIGEPFAAYIIDWVMPDLSGFEIVRQIRRIVGDNVPIIIVTAYDVTAIMDEAKDIGVTAYCNKPIFMSDLRDTLISCLNNGAAKDEANEQNETLKELAGKRLLLVEDNELNREIAEEILLENGFKVECAEDGSVAVEKVKNAETGYYDLVLMDIQMPVMDGYEATREIRALDGGRGDMPIVAMTANAFDEDKQRALDCGMNAHIAKPINIDRLIEVLCEILLPGDKNPGGER